MGKAHRGRRARTAPVLAERIVSGRRLTRQQRERLAAAEMLAVGGLADRRRAASIIRDIERELSEARTSEAVEADIADTLARAKARREAFEVELVEVGEWRRNADGTMVRRNGQIVLDVQTVRRASRVDGLANLYKTGAISDQAKLWGDEYRWLTESALPPVCTSALSPSASGGRDPTRMMVKVAAAGCAGAVISEIGRRIADDRTFGVLNAVAGRGQTIRSLGDGGDMKVANKDRLICALRVVEQVLSESYWRGLASQAR